VFLRLPVVAVKLPVEPDVIVNEAGTLSAVWLLLAVRVMPPEGTLFDRLTVQVLDAL
jgi:hypothetical protein